MNYKAFYAQLFRPIKQQLGPIDPESIVAIIGFDFGGPLNFCTVGAKAKAEFVTYVSCELAVRRDQKLSSAGRFELLCHCNDEDWVRKLVTSIGAMSLEARLDHLHTIDLTGLVGRRAPLRGAVIERFAIAKIDSKNYSLLRVHGVTAKELKFAMDAGSAALFKHLKKHGVFPNTDVRRESTL